MVGVPASLVGGILADRYGRKPVVYMSGAIMTLAATAYIPLSYSPSWHLTLLIAIFFSLGNCAYSAVDWALAVDVLPEPVNSGKDMGIWHSAIVLPQMLSPALTGVVLNSTKASSLSRGYTLVFAITAAWFLLGTLFVRKIRGVR